MSTNAENLITIDAALTEVFGRICSFCLLVQKGAAFALAIVSFTGPIFINFTQDVAKILLLNIFQSEWRYCNAFRNPSLLYVILPILLKIGCKATSLEESGKEVWIDKTQTNTSHLVKNRANRSSRS